MTGGSATSGPATGDSAGKAVTPACFARLMRPFGAFEPCPEVAVAVSGGADSMALALLLKEWLSERGGRLWALTVDHGLRPEAAAEARETGARLEAAGVTQRVLIWEGAKPSSGLQAAARAARYALLTGFCRERGILHLFLAHHLDDQAETFFLRRDRASGPDGLAAMSALRCTPDLRILRPLLRVPKTRLVSTLRAQGQSWIEDPSNRDPRFARVRLRQKLSALSEPGESPSDVSAMVRQRGLERTAHETGAGAFLGRYAHCDPAGFVTLQRAAIIQAREALAQRVLAGVVTAVGGRDYPPRVARLSRLQVAVKDPDFAGATLSRTRILPRGDRLLFCREARHLERRGVQPGETGRWDGRFDLKLASKLGPGRGTPQLRALGRLGLGQLRRENFVPLRSLPREVQVTLPSLWDDFGLIFAPFLGLLSPGLAGCHAESGHN